MDTHTALLHQLFNEFRSVQHTFSCLCVCMQPCRSCLNDVNQLIRQQGFYYNCLRSDKPTPFLLALYGVSVVSFLLAPWFQDAPGNCVLPLFRRPGQGQLSLGHHRAPSRPFVSRGLHSRITEIAFHQRVGKRADFQPKQQKKHSLTQTNTDCRIVVVLYHPAREEWTAFHPLTSCSASDGWVY